MNIQIHLSYLLIFLFSLASPVHAQDNISIPNNELQTDSDKKLKDLSNISKAIKELESSLKSNSNNLTKTDSKTLGGQIEDDLRIKSDKLRKLKLNLDEIASGVDIDSYEELQSDKAIDWVNEIQDLLSPVLNEIKRLTNRPRELDKLHRKISALNTSVQKCNLAIKNINTLIDKDKNLALTSDLNELVNTWTERRNSVVAEISVSQQRLNQLEAESSSIKNSLKQIPELFFRSRARNLVFAIFATFLFWWSSRYFYSKLRLTPIMTSTNFSDYRRLVNLVYLTFSGSGSLIIFLVVLFLLGDWLLLIISFLILFGIGWSSKHAFPHFLNQGTLLLNVGPVREGQVISYRGILWEVVSLNIFVALRNPLLDPHLIRVPLNDLFSLRSRPMGKVERWFPTQIGDWILTNEGVLYKVLSQTIDQVALVTLGGSVVTISTDSYLSQTNMNLSTGFRVVSKIGLSYKHQANITDAIPKLLHDVIKKELDKRLGENEYGLNVELDNASSSSLDLLINLDVDGKYAQDYDGLKRFLQSLIVKACMTYGWEIPYNQLTVHLNNQ